MYKHTLFCICLGFVLLLSQSQIGLVFNSVAGSSSFTAYNLVSDKAASFLLKCTYNSTIGLCSEVKGNTNNSLHFNGSVFWICSDNLFAYYALQNYNKSVSDTIKRTIEAYAKNYSLPTDNCSIPISYKHEPILKNDSLPDWAPPPLGYVYYNLTQKDSYIVMTEVNNNTNAPWNDWYNYSDECAWMGMSYLNKRDRLDALACYNNMTRWWDGYGFADTAYTKPGQPEYGHYEPFKLALAIIFRQRLNLTKPSQEKTMDDILAICQGPDGGIATGYDRSLSTDGHVENTETTALTVIANVSISQLKEIKVGFYYYAWYGDGLGGRHWNDSAVATVVDKPILGYYSSQNTSIIRQHLDWFKELNISFLIISWWGPNSYEDNTTKIIFSMVKQYNYPIEIAIMAEAYNWSGMYDFKAIYNYINDTYIVPYGNIYMRLYDLPIVCFFNDNINMTKTEANRTAIRSVPGFSARIVGHSSYVDWWAWPLAGYKEAPEPRLSRDGYVGILPSYDDTHLPNHTNTTYDVNYTQELYDNQWKKVLALENMTSEVNFVGIYSWNEYHERSEVEPHISQDGKYILSLFSKTYHYIQEISTVPEFPSGQLFALFILTTALVAIVYRRKREKSRIYIQSI